MNIFKKILGTIVAAVFIFGGWVIVKNNAPKSTAEPVPEKKNGDSFDETATTPSTLLNTTSNTLPAVPSPKETTSTKQRYKDGTYIATGVYDSPAGPEKITVSVTLKKDSIVATESSATSSNRRSQQYQNMFLGGYKQYVVGKAIDTVSLDVVSGSSLTPEGFNAALVTIKQKAAI